jgi:hypothetical protein
LIPLLWLVRVKVVVRRPLSTRSLKDVVVWGREEGLRPSPISLTPEKTWRVFFQKDFLPSLKILRKDWGNI